MTTRRRDIGFQVRLDGEELARWKEHAWRTRRPSCGAFVREAVETAIEREQLAEVGTPDTPLPATGDLERSLEELGIAL